MLLSYNNYLFKCDLLYKHKLENSSSVSNLQSVSLSLSLAEFNKDIDPFGIIKNNESELQSKAFLFLYSNFCCLPYIKFVKKKNDNFFLIKLIFSGTKSINLFQYYFYALYLDLLNYLLVTNNKNILVCNSSFLNSHALIYSLNSTIDIITIKNLDFFAYFTIKNKNK
jgi:hypothetical protein